MVTFLLAFSFSCFSVTSHVAIFTIAASWIVVAILVFWTIITGWEGGETSVWVRVKQRIRDVFLSGDDAEQEEQGEDAGSVGGAPSPAVPSESEKEAEGRWWARIRMLTPHSLAHSGDPPMAQLREVSSRV